MATDGLARKTAIVTRALEEVTMTVMTTAVWRAGSVFISNTNFMLKNCSKGGNCIKNCKECAGEGRSCKRREPGVMQLAKVMAMALPWFLGEGSQPSGEEVSISLGFALGLQTDQTRNVPVINALHIENYTSHVNAGFL